MLIATRQQKGTFIVMRCVYFYLQAKTQHHKGVINYVKRETTVVPPLPAARPNRAEAVSCWQTERTRQNYYYLLQMSINTIEQNDQRSRTPTKRGRCNRRIASETYGLIADG